MLEGFYDTVSKRGVAKAFGYHKCWQYVWQYLGS